MHNRRQDDRRRRLEAGRLVDPTSDMVVDCILRDDSGGGARLLVATPLALAPDLDLVVEPDGDTRRVRVVWRGDAVVGIAFVEPAWRRAADDGRVVSLAVAREARHPKADAARLAERVAQVIRPRSRPLPEWVRPG